MMYFVCIVRGTYLQQQFLSQFSEVLTSIQLVAL